MRRLEFSQCVSTYLIILMNKFDKDPSSEAEGVIRRETWKFIIVAT
jgi:hypothetical protein